MIHQTNSAELVLLRYNNEKSHSLILHKSHRILLKMQRYLSSKEQIHHRYCQTQCLMEKTSDYHPLNKTAGKKKLH